MWAHSRFSVKKIQSTSGFTIVELLIVVIVIAILAAITIVAYNGIQNRAKASATQTAASQAAKKIQTFAVDNVDTYPEATGTDGIGNFSSLGIPTSGSSTYQYSANNTVTPRTFCVTATTSNVSYYVSNASSTPVLGACPGHGLNGTAAITNLLLNPSWENSTTLNAVTANTSTSSAEVTSSTDWSNNGSRSLKVALPAGSSASDTAATIAGSNGSLSGLGVTFIAGRTYSIRATINVPAAQTNPSSRARSIYYANSVDGWQTAAPFVTQAPNTPGTYTLSTTFTVPLGATWFNIRLYNGSPAPNGPVYWDSVILAETNTPPIYLDGNSTNWVWNGTANNATSTGMQP